MSFGEGWEEVYMHIYKPDRTACQFSFILTWISTKDQVNYKKVMPDLGILQIYFSECVMIF